ncbi:MAG: PP2C family protein-serine/threonine phosphatase [Planctomycetota bacterium]|jgi:serine phosphatase RsbU (regulator of sigma subunit)
MNQQVQSQQLQCMEIIGGNHAVHQAISSPGLDVWVDSRPLKGDVGGDIHYFSMCGSGRVTRLVVADVSGHGPVMDQTAKSLRKLMRKYINLLDQTRFAKAVNREFTQQVDSDYFATVLLTTYFAPTDHFIICNAGHPRPIWYNTRTDKWLLLDRDTPDTGPSICEEKVNYCLKPVSNLPLGIIEPTDYYQFATKLSKGDLLLIYTDALIEAKSPNEKQLGEEGLLELARQLDHPNPQEVCQLLLDKVDGWRGHAAPDDDQTLIVLHHNASDPPAVTVAGALKTMLKMIGLKKV